MAALKFNTAIARLFELNNQLTRVSTDGGESPREVVEPLILMLAPLTPHIAEELWARLGHDPSLAFEPFPEPDEAELVVDTAEIAVQVNGKTRARVAVPVDATEAAVEAVARAEPRVAAALGDAPVRKVIVVPRRLVNFVLG